MNLKIAVVAIVVIFGLGFLIGSSFEKRYWENRVQVAENEESLTYDGKTYCQVMSKNSLEQHLTAAGERK